ncbi:hypothetical protein ACLOJK_017676, partial [Asimina triloba]
DVVSSMVSEFSGAPDCDCCLTKNAEAVVIDFSVIGHNHKNKRLRDRHRPPLKPADFRDLFAAIGFSLAALLPVSMAV